LFLKIKKYNKVINLWGESMAETLMKKSKLNAVQVLAIGFALVILIGGIILSLPISSVDGK
jgi:trk system potassium uptake protein